MGSFYKITMLVTDEATYYKSLLEAIRSLASAYLAATYRHTNMSCGQGQVVSHTALGLTLEQVSEIEGLMEGPADSWVDVLDPQGRLVAVISRLQLEKVSTGAPNAFPDA
jgi:hypothetical protein